MATVTTDAIPPTTLPMPDPSQSRMRSATSWISALMAGDREAASACARSSSTPDWIDRTMPIRSGAIHRTTTTIAPTPMTKARAVAAAEDAVDDHPRSRRRPTIGANDAATTSASRMDTVTVPSTTEIHSVTAARPAMASSRQLIAPVRRSQDGMTGSAGVDTVTAPPSARSRGHGTPGEPASALAPG